MSTTLLPFDDRSTVEAYCEIPPQLTRKALNFSAAIKSVVPDSRLPFTKLLGELASFETSSVIRSTPNDGLARAIEATKALTLARDEHRDDVIAGYGTDVNRDMIRAWRSWRCLVTIRWLYGNDYGPPEEYPEVAVLRSS